jgi:peptidoglycan biosynthesis protein MviN/MurJ (putative lipid II flippase)
VNAIGYGTLQARKDFTPSALVPIVVPVVTLAAVLTIGADVRALILGLTLGTSAETVLVYRRLATSGLRI